MTVLDELVKAVAEAANGEWTERYGSEAKAVVAAVLRALPESEAVRQALIEADLATVMFIASDGYPATRVRSNEGAVVRALAALAKLADDE